MERKDAPKRAMLDLYFQDLARRTDSASPPPKPYNRSAKTLARTRQPSHSLALVGHSVAEGNPSEPGLQLGGSFPESDSLWTGARLRLTVAGTGDADRTVELSTPYARVGSDPRCELCVPDLDLPPLVYYLHANDRGLEAWPLSDPADRRRGPITQGHLLPLGPGMLQVERIDESGRESQAASAVSWPEVTITFQGRRWPKVLHRPVTIVGKQRPSFLRLHGARLAVCHAALIAEEGQMWLLGLQTSNEFESGDPKDWQIRRIAVGETVELGAAQATLMGWITAAPRPIFSPEGSNDPFNDESDGSFEAGEEVQTSDDGTSRSGLLLGAPEVTLVESGLKLDDISRHDDPAEVLAPIPTADQNGSDVWREVVADVAANGNAKAEHDRRWSLGPDDAVTVEPLNRSRMLPPRVEKPRAELPAQRVVDKTTHPAPTAPTSKAAPQPAKPSVKPLPREPEALTDHLTKRLQHRQRMHEWPRYAAFGGLIFLILIAAFFTLRAAWNAWMPE
jgi:hypothetical protein